MSRRRSRARISVNDKVCVTLVTTDPLHADLLQDMALVDEQKHLLEDVRVFGTVTKYISPHFHVFCPALEETLMVNGSDCHKSMTPTEIAPYYVAVAGEVKTVEGLILPCKVAGYHVSKEMALQEIGGDKTSQVGCKSTIFYYFP